MLLIKCLLFWILMNGVPALVKWKLLLFKALPLTYFESKQNKGTDFTDTVTLARPVHISWLGFSLNDSVTSFLTKYGIILVSCISPEPRSRTAETASSYSAPRSGRRKAAPTTAWGWAALRTWLRTPPPSAETWAQTPQSVSQSSQSVSQTNSCSRTLERDLTFPLGM